MPVTVACITRSTLLLLPIIASYAVAATAASPSFSLHGGWITGPTSITIDSPGALIRYTTDCSWPSETNGQGGQASVTIDIDTTTVVRAIAYGNGYLPSKVSTHTYFLSSDIIRQTDLGSAWPRPSDFEDWGTTNMDQAFVDSNEQATLDALAALPTLALSTSMADMFDYDSNDPDSDVGIMANGMHADGNPDMDPLNQNWERLCSAEWFTSDRERGFAVTCGLRIAGAGGRSRPKKSMALEFRERYGPPSLSYPIFERGHVQRFDELRLRAPWMEIKTQMNMAFVDRVDHAMAGESQRSRFVHLFLNGLYWGIYDLSERACAGFAKSHYGGSKDAWDTARYNGAFIADGNKDAYTFCDQLDDLGDPERYALAQRYVDIDRYIDYVLLVLFFDHIDAYEDRAIRDRERGIGFKHFIWDTETQFKFMSVSESNPLGIRPPPDDIPTTTFLHWFRMFDEQSPQFRQRFRDRAQWHLHNGALRADALLDIYRELRAEMEPAITADAARWRGRHLPADYTSASLTDAADRLESWLPLRRSGLLSWLRSEDLYRDDAPTIDPPGGGFTGNDTVTITRPMGATGTIVYRTDGQDPLDVGGTEHNGDTISFTIENNVVVCARVREGNSWSTLARARFTTTQDLTALQITEIMYHPPDAKSTDTNTGILGRYYDGGESNGGFKPRAISRDERIDEVIDFSWGDGPAIAGGNSARYCVDWAGFVIPAYSEDYYFTLEADGYANVWVDGVQIIDAWNDNVRSDLVGHPIALQAGKPVWLRVHYAKDGGDGFVQLRWSSNSQSEEIIPSAAFTLAGNDRSLEFIELKNTGMTTLDLSGLNFAAGIRYRFPEHTLLPSGAFAVLVADPVAFARHYPNVTITGSYAGTLNNDGEMLKLTDADDNQLILLAYNDATPWPAAPDGNGFSLVPVDATVPANSSNAAHWRPSTNVGGSPGADDPAPGATTAVLISEALAHSNDSATPSELDFIELYNPDDKTVTIGGWYLSDDKQHPRKFRLPDNTLIEAHGYVTFDESSFNTGDNAFALSSLGEQVFLFAADGNDTLTGYSHGFSFEASETSVSFGRHVISTGEEHFVAQISQSRGEPNIGVVVGPVVIAEVMYHPADGSTEYIELVNISNQTISLYDSTYNNAWRLAGIDYDFPSDTILAPNARLLLIRGDPADFRNRHGIPSTVAILGPYAGALDNGGETLRLQRPDTPTQDKQGETIIPMITIDRLDYLDESPWPSSPDGTGYSLARSNLRTYGNDPANWHASIVEDGTPGRPNVRTISITTDGSPSEPEINNGTPLPEPVGAGYRFTPLHPASTHTINWPPAVISAFSRASTWRIGTPQPRARSGIGTTFSRP